VKARKKLYNLRQKQQDEYNAEVSRWMQRLTQQGLPFDYVGNQHLSEEIAKIFVEPPNAFSSEREA
jgi:hypothetical protein